ncbi:MAG: amino acid adenylation domain-containing protein [Verrucomicrobiales bacterium]
MKKQTTAAIAPPPVNTERVPFDLTLSIVESGSMAITATIHYRSTAFHRETVTQLGGHFRNILTQFAKITDIARSWNVLTLPLLSPAERSLQLNGWNHTSRPRREGETFCDLFRSAAERSPGNPAVCDRNSSLTYEQLNDRSARIARLLEARGIGSGQSVAFCVDRSVDMVAVMLGIQRCGACYIPLDPSYPATRIEMILEDALPGAVIVEREFACKIPDALRIPSITLDDPATQKALESIGSHPLPPQPTAADLAYIIFTSGSTGRPKGVEISQRALHNTVLAMAEHPGFAAGDTMLALATVCFDISVMEMFLPLGTGGNINVVSRDEARDGHLLAKVIESGDATVIQGTPATFQLLLDSGWRGKQTGRPLRILCGGEEMPTELAKRLLDLKMELWNMYGPTETTVWSTAERLVSADDITVGRPIANTSCYILDECGQPVPAGVRGELCIGGRSVGAGYHRNEKLTASHFVPNPFSSDHGGVMYRTGDLARFRHDGRLEFFGRIDHQVKIRGFRIELGEISSALEKHPDVNRAVVVASDLPGGKALVAYVEPTGANPSELLEHSRAILPAYMVPTRIVSLDALPMTASGKIDRKRLPEPTSTAALPDSASTTAPRTELERRVALIWEDLLKVESVGIEDDFFGLGGHSLLAAQAFARMREDTGFGAGLSLNAIFEDSSLGGVVARLESAEADLESDLPPGVILLHPGSIEHPTDVMFWLHPLGGGGGGGLLSYRQIARSMEVRSYGIRENGDSFESFEAMAAAYAERIDQVHPTGSCSVAGFCFGGNLALEVGRQLHKRGRKVTLAALIDATPEGHSPTAFPPANEHASSRTEKSRWMKNVIMRMWQMSPPEKKRLLRRRFRAMKWHATQAIIGHIDGNYVPPLDDIIDLSKYPESYRVIARHHWRLLRNHQDTTFDFPLLLIRSCPSEAASAWRIHPDPTDGWSRLTEDHVEVVRVEGTHDQFLNRNDMMEASAQAISRHLQTLSSH